MNINLKEIAMQVEEDLKKLGKRIVAYHNGELDEDPLEEFTDRILDISRTQQLLSDGWETTSYEVCLGWGGPGTWLETGSYTIRVAWWEDYVEWHVYDPDAREAIDMVHDYLHEIYG
ncbi:MAG: hypothetical protein H0Z19_11815 [Archaeoglobus sp.]|uniref:hypothetical protein n=1 Tax=Archaeoglobus sp. TaxID=1872626 RepID=UPI001DA06933|nr:hypothetical protein [Archaeoglobus sp.]MBO8181135.1 hypothetical protein [Archaeoglobus sp.]